AFGVHRCRAQMSGTWQKPALALEFDLVCEDFPGWSFPARLQLRDDLAPKQWRAEMNALATGSHKDLEKHLLSLTSWKDLPMSIQQKAQGTAPLRARFSLPGLPPIELGARLAQEGRLSFDGLPDVSTRLLLAERVAAAEKTLAP